MSVLSVCTTQNRHFRAFNWRRTFNVLQKLFHDILWETMSISSIYCFLDVKNNLLLHLFFYQSMLFTVSNEKTAEISKRYQNLKENNYWFYQCLIRDIASAVCLDCVYNILKIGTYKKIGSIQKILDNNCYLTSTSNDVILYSNEKPVDSIEKMAKKNCLKIADYFFD